MKTNWFEENIEEKIRPTVKLLRDNGFNTECSCGHKMYVQCQWPMNDDGEFFRLDQLLYNNGYRTYKIEAWLHRCNGVIMFSGFEVKFKNDECIEEIK